MESPSTEVDLSGIRRFGSMLPLPFSLLSPEGGSVWCNDAYCELVGLTFDEVMARSMEAAVHPDDFPALERAHVDVISGGSVDLELRVLHADGRFLNVQWGMRCDPETGMVAAIGLNVTGHRERARALRREADQDSLTGLANRAAVMRTLADWAESPGRVTVAIVDLDGFKLVNDRMGHRVGDQALRAVADRLRLAAPDDALVGRLGGDEFVVLVPGTGTAAVADLGERLRNLNGRISIGSRRLHVSVSVGISDGQSGRVEAPPSGRADVLLQQADHATYTAKSQGRGRVVRYDRDLWQADRRRRQIEALIQGALQWGGITAHLQPIVATDDGRIIGVEALARLASGDSLVDAAGFLDVAAHMGVTGQVGAMVRCEALAAARRLPEHVSLFLNLDVDDLLDPDALPTLLDQAEAAGVPASRLVLEVTEVLLVRDVALAAPQLLQARRRGARIAIDDFGVGTSSLGQLGGLRVDLLKVDRTFVRDARQDSRGVAVLHAMAALGSALGADVVVEGVETRADLALARSLGVAAAQGWYVGRPMSGEDVEALLDG